MKVLIVDDDFVSRSLIQTVLSNNGFKDIEMVVTGQEAIEAAQIAYGKGSPYKLIFLDRIMPGEDGIETLNKLRDDELDRGLDSGSSATIIMVTSVDSPDKVMDAFKDQCDQYVVKPISEEKIMSAIEKTGIKSRN